MASKKRQFEGIAMLSMYNDEEEEEEEMEEVAEEEERPQEEDEKVERPQPAREQQDGDYLDSRMADQDDLMAIDDREVGADSAYDDTPPMESENTSPQPRVSVVSPQQEAADSTRMSRRGKLTIVDYGHDEVAMSPEPEDGEIVGSGRVMFGEELQTANGHFQDKTPPGTVQASTPSNQMTLPSSDPSQYDAMNHAVCESEGEHVEEAGREQEKEVNPLDKFLPPPPKEKCSEELQRKINKFLEYKKAGKSFNSEVRNRKDYRNPDFLLHAVRYQDIDQIGSCFSKDVFDPHGYDKSDYFDEIEADMRREEQEKKKSQKVDFVSGIQPGAVASAPKINLPIPGSKKTVSVNSLVKLALGGVSTSTCSGLLSIPIVADTASRDGRQNKKSKWDKVLIYAYAICGWGSRNPLPSWGKDSISTAGVHAVLLSAANAGAGYMAFA
ncbi:SAP30-binding protein [Morella rubra]|uniref:SAP30-binding protein n=1 Tax=Morella rubra TaxID=262757 RepID=A0A6A1WHU2_9ROSI|nr:SAP30-binding protein [Morella rubra]